MSLTDIIVKIISAFIPEFKLENNGKIKLTFFSNIKLIDLKVENNNYNINIDLNKTTPEQRKQVEMIYPEIKEQNGLILQNNNYTDLNEYIEEIKETPILKYFKGKLIEQDYEALRVSMFIKRKSDSGGDISVYLDQLYRKFGVRGRNICNLNGENYFDSFIKPYYALLESQNRQQDFAKGFEKFVMEQPITYFVNQHKTQEQLEQELFNKIKISKKYGIKGLNIHCIGEQNKKKLKEFIKKIEGDPNIKIISINEEGSRMSVFLEIS